MEFSYQTSNYKYYQFIIITSSCSGLKKLCILQKDTPVSLAPNKQFWVPIIGILLPLILGATPMGPLDQAEIVIAGQKYLVELAAKPEQRRKGLMWRGSLSDDRGMLLIYPQDGDHRIWMKNVLIPLQVFWIDSDYRIVFHRRLEPCRSSPCPVYAAPEPSRFVLELNDSSHSIRIGDLVDGINR